MQAIARSARSDMTEHARPDQATTPSAAALDAREGCAVERRLSRMSVSVSVSATVAEASADPEADFEKSTAAAEGRGSGGPSELQAPSPSAASTIIVDGIDDHSNQACRDTDTAPSHEAVDATATTTAARTTDDNAIPSDDVTSSSADVTSSWDDVITDDDVSSSADVTSSTDDVITDDDVTSSSADVTSYSASVTSAGDAPAAPRIDEVKDVSVGLERRVLDGEGGAEERSEDRPGRSELSSYDFGKSTAENYRVEHRKFSDR